MDVNYIILIMVIKFIIAIKFIMDLMVFFSTQAFYSFNYNFDLLQTYVNYMDQKAFGVNSYIINVLMEDINYLAFNCKIIMDRAMEAVIEYYFTYLLYNYLSD